MKTQFICTTQTGSGPMSRDIVARLIRDARHGRCTMSTEGIWYVFCGVDAPWRLVVDPV